MHRSLGVVQEWSALKDNQRLDFFVLLYQDKRTKKIRSDFLSDRSVSFSKIELYLSHLTFLTRIFCYFSITIPFV